MSEVTHQQRLQRVKGLTIDRTAIDVLNLISHMQRSCWHTVTYLQAQLAATYN